MRQKFPGAEENRVEDVGEDDERKIGEAFDGEAALVAVEELIAKFEVSAGE